MMKKNSYLLNILVIPALIFLTACSDGGSEEEGVVLPDTSPAESESPIVVETIQPTIAPTEVPLPTPTPERAALVNGQPILLKEYEEELARYELATAELGIDPDKNENGYRDPVLYALIERELIRQAAAEQGITISPDTLTLKMNGLRESTGEQRSFDEWLAANLWTEEEFQKAFEAELIVEKMVAVITADVPTAMEQVHVLYIQIDDSDLAQSLLGQLKDGGDFADLANRYSLDQATAPYGGDLGFFARGSLLVPEVETAAFKLQLDEISDIISVSDPDSGLTTYYIVKLVERDPSRMLGADLRQRLLQEAFDNWLEEQEMGATIINYLEEDQ